MENNQRTAPNTLHKERGKDNQFLAQKKRVFAALYRQPKTMLMVSIETGIFRANICRYVAEWKKEGRIYLVRTGFCPISKHRSAFYTTNPELFWELNKNC